MKKTSNKKKKKRIDKKKYAEEEKCNKRIAINSRRRAHERFTLFQ